MRIENIFYPRYFYEKNFKNQILYSKLNELWKKLDIFNDGSCVACYPLNGNANDLSGTYNGTWEGNEQYQSGINNLKSSYLNGDSYILTPNLINSLGNSKNVSITLWFNAQNYGVLIDELSLETIQNNFGWHDAQIEIYSDGTLLINIWQLSIINMGKINYNQWYFVSLVYDENQQKLFGYLNGNLIGSISGSRMVSWENGWTGIYYGIGRYDSTYLTPSGLVIQSNDSISNSNKIPNFTGKIQQVRFFNRPLTPSEIQYLYKNKC